MNTEISVSENNGERFVSLTDIAKHVNPEAPKDVIKNWLRNRSTIEYLGLWETLNNKENFNRVEFDSFIAQSGSNSFVLSPSKWIARTNASGIRSSAGRYGGGTFAHEDIALEFASWISSAFRLYLTTEFKRLKGEEQKQLGWTVKRELTKLNYRIHTDAIKRNLIPPELDRKKASIIYANEADVLNIAMFGMTAQEWREQNPEKLGNTRDYATVNELLCLANLENLNSVFIDAGMSQSERLMKLNQIAISQMKILEEYPVRLLPSEIKDNQD